MVGQPIPVRIRAASVEGDLFGFHDLLIATGIGFRGLIGGPDKDPDRIVGATAEGIEGREAQ